MAKRRILIDIGSTFTKALAVDLEQEIIVAAAASPTTVQEDVTIGIQNTLAIIEHDSGFDLDSAEITACSSAAGGLRMVSIGLIPELSSEAAKRAALGAGAKIIDHYCHQMTRKEIKEIEAIAPDIILLAGGTDGGNDKAILYNAMMLAKSEVHAPILVAGNKCSYDRIEDMFNTSSKSAVFVENVMPEIGRLEVQPCRDAIRDIFMRNIIKAKGLDRAKRLVGDIIMPTPAAVLNAATLLADGVAGEEGLGELIMIDVGGATTDVYSIAKGNPASSLVLLKGLPEPYAKRTVEGDLGVRHNIDVLVEICHTKNIMPDEQVLANFQQN
ncbi:MAG TPA: glutamate mutase L, partial [Syntrophorhabdaceae bacterium]|nr:glutamate mutase L [Syntrophorhabdaceae bacterium]